MKEQTNGTPENLKDNGDNRAAALWSNAAVVAFFIIVVFSIVLFIRLAAGPPETLPEHRENEPAAGAADGRQMRHDPFSEIDIEGEAAFVYDAATGEVLFARNPDKRMPLASLAKLMTALVASELVPLSTVVEVERADIATEGDTGLLVGERWRLRDMIDYTLLTSSNDGASAIATIAGSMGQSVYDMPRSAAKQSFVGYMNRISQDLGLLHTYFLNETGLDVNTAMSGAYSTAREIAALANYIITRKPELAESTARGEKQFASLDGIDHTATNTNAHLGDIPGVIISKTGFTDLAGGNLVVAFDTGIAHPVIAVVLGSTFEGRFEDIRKLARATRALFGGKQLPRYGKKH